MLLYGQHFVWRCFGCLIKFYLVFSISMGVSQAQESPGLNENVHELLARLPICDAAKTFKVPPEVVAGVFLFENQINRGLKDTLQDGAFRILLEIKNEKWWRNWAQNAMEMSNSAERARLYSNKWPVEVVATGFVVSIGPAQVTPRSALKACEFVKPKPNLCAGVKYLIAGMLDKSKSIEIVAAVLRFEADAHRRLTGVDASEDFGLWATLYNEGGDYFRNHYNQQCDNVNRFGKWVRLQAANIKMLLNCAL